MTTTAETQPRAIAGHATREGTARYRDRATRERGAAPGHFRFEQDLWLSSVGIGTYLGEADEETDRAYEDAVFRAVELGANVIDSAVNYRFQRGERSVGAAIRRLIEEGVASRDELVVCTKGGYVPFDSAPPASRAEAREYVERTFVETGVASLTDFVGGSHCMTPRYLQHQLEQSLGNLGLETIDVYYIHNPESQLGGVPSDEFDRRLRAAFRHLERAVARSYIKNYGVATWNGFRVETGAREYHPIERMAEIAREVAGERHHFRFVQLPFNLAMPEALTFANQSYAGEKVSLLEAARALGITVVASASIFQGRVARNLPESIREPLGSLASDAQTAIQFVRSTPGVTTALVGMSSREHVEENLQLARVELAGADDYQRVFEQG
ncbi:MAG TPA: aldo/keto reductase [Pyrinomonadaceae bacterium]|nr:aldo/keto reductase [Pyrinomonadaceae bacterium]